MRRIVKECSQLVSSVHAFVFEGLQCDIAVTDPSEMQLLVGLNDQGSTCSTQQNVKLSLIRVSGANPPV